MNFFTSFVLILNFIIINKSAPLNSEEAMEFLMEFGFANNKTTDKEVENSVKKYQKIFNLAETGKLDAATLAQMDQPMCGRPDRLEITNDLKVWPKNYLTYQIKNGPFSGRLNKRRIEDELREAFKIWAKHIPLSFEKNTDYADIEIRFIDPENKEDTDGRGKTLAYAYYPDKGDIYFDAEDWSLDSSKGYNFRIVAAHEIGHSLGLGHSRNKKSLMYPAYKPLKAGWTLHESDISTIKKLYNSDQVCQFGQIDGIFNHDEKTVVVVKGQYCWKFEKNKLKNGYPKLCEKLWKNFPEKIDAIFKYDNQINYFWENQLFSHRNNGKHKINFNKANIKKIDAAFTIDDRLYIFGGAKYWTFLRKNYNWSSKADAKLIADFWNGIPSNLDAAIFDNKKYVYFFKNSEVYKFDIDSKNTVNSPILINEYFQC